MGYRFQFLQSFISKMRFVFFFLFCMHILESSQHLEIVKSWDEASFLILQPGMKKRRSQKHPLGDIWSGHMLYLWVDESSLCAVTNPVCQWLYAIAINNLVHHFIFILKGQKFYQRALGFFLSSSLNINALLTQVHSLSILFSLQRAVEGSCL